MKPFLFAAIVAFLTLSVLRPDPAEAAKTGKGKLPKAKPTPVPEKVNASGSKIAKVGGDSITIEYSKTSTTYKMSAETLITIDGNKARSTDLRPGMHAEISPSAINPGLLLSIKATSVPKT
jgi:hypothetical protein